VTSGTTLHYWAIYASPSGIASLARYDGNSVATSAADGTVHNATHHELYSGFVVLTKSVAIVTNCSGAVPASGVCPGGTLTYTVDYRSLVTYPGTGNTEPAAAILITKPGLLVLSDDGTLGTNNWATFTNGINANATDTTAGTIFTYTPGNPPGSTKFTAQVGGAAFSLQAAGTGGCLNANGCAGQIVFAVTVK
jgi:hypothetical protein